eukprot:c8045_g1_i1.p1 GENE.c8045_g1_i1~~c8045_g1_i1.p1  ORF type:complete len:260 (-),score=43.71 c8045_g1_i1:36-815(-)
MSKDPRKRAVSHDTEDVRRVLTERIVQPAIHLVLPHITGVKRELTQDEYLDIESRRIARGKRFGQGPTGYKRQNCVQQAQQMGIQTPTAAEDLEGTSKMLSCPYNRNHIMNKERIVRHMLKCADKLKVGNDFATCRYNTMHIVPKTAVEDHENRCKHAKLSSANHSNMELAPGWGMAANANATTTTPTHQTQRHHEIDEEVRRNGWGDSISSHKQEPVKQDDEPAVVVVVKKEQIDDEPPIAPPSIAIRPAFAGNPHRD